MKKLIVALLLSTGFSAQAMDNVIVTEQVSAYVNDICAGNNPNITKQDLIELLRKKNSDVSIIYVNDIDQLSADIFKNKNKHYKKKWRDAFQQEMRSLLNDPAYEQVQTQKESWPRRAANAVLAKSSAWIKSLRGWATKDAQIADQPLHNTAPGLFEKAKDKTVQFVHNAQKAGNTLINGVRTATHETDENPYTGVEGLAYAGICKGRELKNKIAPHINHAAGKAYKAVADRVRTTSKAIADKFRSKDEEYPEAGIVVTDEPETVTAQLKATLQQQAEPVIEPVIEESETTVQPAIETESVSPILVQENQTESNVQNQSTQAESVDQDDNEDLGLNILFNQDNATIWANHKGKILAALGSIGTLGTLIAGYKFFATQAQQIKMLETTKHDVSKVVDAMQNAAKLKKIKLNIPLLSRLTKENQAALQKHADMFNGFIAKVKANKERASFRQQATVVRNLGKALIAVLDTCITQVKDKPVSKPGFLHRAADKFGSFCASVKYYAWDKWVTSKKVTVA